MYYYILVDPDRSNVYKVGITKNINQRLKAYRTQAPNAFFHKVYELPDAKKHEKNLLYELKGVFKVNSEVVYGNLQLIQNIIEGYLFDKNIFSI